jgi:asparagine synthase (glutamine-hydrolysing)
MTRAAADTPWIGRWLPITSTYLAGDLLPKTDRTTMAHSLEARAPFLDVEWVEWTARLPDRAKIRGMGTKWLLGRLSRSAAGTIRRRGKQGFSLPIGPWLRGDLRAWARERLVDNRLSRNGSGRRRFVNCWTSTTRAVQSRQALWALLMFAVWLNLYARS